MLSWRWRSCFGRAVIDAAMDNLRCDLLCRLSSYIRSVGAFGSLAFSRLDVRGSGDVPSGSLGRGRGRYAGRRAWRRGGLVAAVGFAAYLGGGVFYAFPASAQLTCSPSSDRVAFPGTPTRTTGCAYRLGVSGYPTYRPIIGCCVGGGVGDCRCVPRDPFDGSVIDESGSFQGIGCVGGNPSSSGSFCDAGSSCYYYRDGEAVSGATLDESGFCVPPVRQGDACYTDGGLPGLIDSALACQAFRDGDSCWTSILPDNRPGPLDGYYYGGECIPDSACATNDERWFDGICYEVLPVATGNSSGVCDGVTDEGELLEDWDCCPTSWAFLNPADPDSCYITCPGTGAIGWNERPDGSCYTMSQYDIDGCSNDSPPCTSNACPPGTQAVINGRCYVAYCNEADTDCYDSDTPGEPCRGDDCETDDPAGRPAPSPIAAPDDDDGDDDTSTTSGARPGGDPGSGRPGGGGGFASGGGGGGGSAGGSEPGGSAGGDGDASGVGGAGCPRGSVWRTDDDTGAVFCVCPEDSYEFGGECVEFGGARGNFGATGESFGFPGAFTGLLSDARRFAGFDDPPSCRSFLFGPIELGGVERHFRIPPADILSIFCTTLVYMRSMLISIVSLFALWQFAQGYREAFESMSAAGAVGVILGTTFSVGAAVPAAWSLAAVLMVPVDAIINLIEGYSTDAAVVMDWFFRAGAKIFIQMLIFAVSVRWSLVMSATFGRSLNWW